MLERHLMGTSAKVGIGANRATAANQFLERYGHIDSCTNNFFENLLLVNKVGTDVTSDKIGVAILDDGMQVIFVLIMLFFSFFHMFVYLYCFFTIFDGF